MGASISCSAEFFFLAGGSRFRSGARQFLSVFSAADALLFLCYSLADCLRTQTNDSASSVPASYPDCFSA
jgi:hypothetical protein